MRRAEAKALSLKRYDGGKACVVGHGTLRYTSSGDCVVCSATKVMTAYHADPIKARAQRRAWDRANPEKKAAYDARWQRENPGKVQARNKRWLVKNQERFTSYQRQWCIDNIVKKRTYCRNYRARFADAEGTFTDNDIFALYDAQHALCPYCNADLALGFEIDHIIPISRGGSNWPWNLQLTCLPCNRRKADKHPDVFAQEMCDEWDRLYT